MSLGSGSRSSASRTQSRRYRRLAASSRVDETLFGRLEPVSSRTLRGGNATVRKPQHGERQTIQIITKDLIRTLRVRNLPGECALLPLAEFERIQSTSLVPSQREEAAARKEASQKKQEAEMRAAEEMKRKILEADMDRGGKKVLTEQELEAQERAQAQVERAGALRVEQEQEIRTLNKLILDAQCQATRDAQILEKQQIKAELAQEEKRLDSMMDMERHMALAAEKEIDDLRKQQRISGKEQIYHQIQRCQEEKLMQEEMKKLERDQMLDRLEKMNLEDLKALEKKKEEQQCLKEENIRINSETIRAKERRREEEKKADLRDLEYMKNKMEQEAEYEEEQKRIKKEKDLEIARMRARQERAKDYKAEQDELRARRHQESVNREWRKREKELAAKKVQEEEMLRAARLEQVRCKEHFLSVEAGREKAEFERVLRAEQEAVARRQQQEEQQRQMARRHAEAIQQQVRERELSAVARRRQTFQEGHQLEERNRQRNARLQEMKERKLKELRATGLPDKYCGQVERRA